MSAWGKSWGKSWGTAWGSVEDLEEEIVARRKGAAFLNKQKRTRAHAQLIQEEDELILSAIKSFMEQVA